MASRTMKLNTGQEMPAFGFGTWQADTGVVAKSLKVALEAGYRHIDCAHCYGNEAEIGELFSFVFSEEKIKREDVFIVSKLWVKDFTTVKDACKLSLKNLRVAYLDLYLIHLPFELEKDLEALVPTKKGVGVIGYDPDRIQVVWKEMEALVNEGLVKSIGVSNFTIHKLDELLKRSPSIRPSCNQVELHPYLPQDRLTEYCKKEDIAIVAYSPLGSPGRPASFVHENHPVLLQDSVVKVVAEKHKATSAQVLLAWGINRGIGVLAKSVSESRIKENLGNLNVALDTDDMLAINGIKTRFRFLDQNWALKIEEEVATLWDGEFLG